MGAFQRWIRPEVYPLIVPMVLVLGLCGTTMMRNITGNPEVRVNKEKRAAGILENHEEGKKHAQHFVRRSLRNREPQIMPSINRFFSDPTKN